MRHLAATFQIKWKAALPSAKFHAFQRFRVTAYNQLPVYATTPYNSFSSHSHLLKVMEACDKYSYFNMSTYESNSENEREAEFESDCGIKFNIGNDGCMPTYRKQLLETLQSVKQFSNYTYGDSLHEFCLPCINVLGIGSLCYPLCEHGLKAIVARCEQAPFGRGEETVIDTTVRNTWQLSPTEFTIENKHEWEAFVDKLAEKACYELGFTDAFIEKRLHKLLIYEQGGFFRPHRDSEKEKGMIASLIVILPSKYEGGQLVIRHNSKEKEFDFGGPKSGCTINYAAFYADCEHEVCTITQGHRLCLVYNIINTGQDPSPLPFDNTTLVKQIASDFQLWESDPNGPIKLVYLLEHRYTNNSLSFSNLKGRDRAVAQLMKQVQSYIGTMMVLTNLKWKYKYEFGPEEESNYNFGKMIMAPSIDVNGGKFADKGLGVFTQDQVLNSELFNSRRPQEVREIPTGNEGVLYHYQYQATGLVFCPKKNSSIVTCDLMGAELSIANMVMITKAEEAHEQALALIKSTVLKPLIDCNGWHNLDSDDPISNIALLVRLLAFLREFRLVNEYLDVLKQIVICVKPHPDLSSELVQGYSELGWVELAPFIRQYVDRYTDSGTEIALYFHSLAFSLIPDEIQQRQSRSDLLHYILKKINDKINDQILNAHSLSIFIESLHHLGYHSLVSDLIKNFTNKMLPYKYFCFNLDSVLLIIKTTTNACLLCDGFETSIQPYLVSLTKPAISALSKKVFELHKINWDSILQCKCKNCKKLRAFMLSLTAQTEKFTMDYDDCACSNCCHWNYSFWREKIRTWAEIEIVLDTVEREDNPVAKKTKMIKETKAFILTKLPLSKELEQMLQDIKYLQSLPYYHATE